MYEIRRDPTTNEQVVISTERAKRPLDTSPLSEAQPHTSDQDCPFCPGNEHRTPPEIFAQRSHGNADDPNWELRIVPNKYPALIQNAPNIDIEPGLFDRMPGEGRHEVVIETPDHDLPFGQNSDLKVAALFRSIKERVSVLRKLPEVEYVAVFKNAGRKAGISLSHPHSQILALPLIPPALHRRMKRIDQFFEVRGGCLICNIIEDEIKKGARVVFTNGQVLVLAPFAPKTPFETWILPCEHVSLFEKMSDRTLVSMAIETRNLTAAITQELGHLDFNLNFIDGSSTLDPAGRFHFFLKVVPRVTAVAGFELGTEMFMNTHAPEEAARTLRNHYSG